jgi:predicted kinase
MMWCDATRYQASEDIMSNETDSIIDAVFDSATAWAVYGLGASKRGLEATARWLEARAKVIGELATKLAAPPASAKTDEASGPQKA